MANRQKTTSTARHFSQHSPYSFIHSLIFYTQWRVSSGSRGQAGVPPSYHPLSLLQRWAISSPPLTTSRACFWTVRGSWRTSREPSRENSTRKGSRPENKPTTGSAKPPRHRVAPQRNLIRPPLRRAAFTGGIPVNSPPLGSAYSEPRCEQNL